MFERLKEAIRKHRDQRGLTTGTILESGMITAFSAGSAGAVAAVITTPVDVVKTRIMLSAAEDAAHDASSRQAKNGPNGLVDAFGKSVKPTKDTVRNAARSLNPLLSDERKGKQGAWKIGKDIVHEKGFAGLWRGGALRGVWTMLGSGLYLGVYESGRIFLASRRGEHISEEELL